MSEQEHFNVRVFIEQVVKADPGTTYSRNDPKPNKIVTPVEIKVTASSLDSAVRKVKAYLDIEVEEQGK